MSEVAFESAPSAVARDVEKYKAAGAPSSIERLVAAARASGRNPIRLYLDYRRLARGRGRLKFEEFLDYELYDDRFSADEKSRFISAYQHWPLYDECIGRNWWAVTEDKHLSYNLLAAAGIRTPETIAVYDSSIREYPGARRLAGADDLRAFLVSEAEFPIFCKAQSAMWSVGAFMLSGADENGVDMLPGGRVAYQDLVAQHLGKDAYLFQKVVRPHSFFDGIGSALGTVRQFNLITDDGPLTPFSVLKLPQGDNVADNFWRDGNIVCDLDSETGEVRSIVSRGQHGLVRHESFPGSARGLIGERLPFWKEARELNRKVALMHAPIRYSSTDIAITDDGPVMIEVNSGGAFELAQVATGRGFLTDEVVALFRSLGSRRV